MTKLYHYCSIETLECILKYKSFRLSSLAVVDDMEEAITSDFDEIGRICFVTCWTDNSIEDAAMWRSYTENRNGNKSGVRISLPDNLFYNINNTEVDVLQNKFDVSISPSGKGLSGKAPILFPVTYTNDESLIKLSVHKISSLKCDRCGNEEMQSNITTTLLGKFKRQIWSGQSEWRYSIIAIPNEYIKNQQAGKYNGSNSTLEERIELMDSDLKTVPYKHNYIDFPIAEGVLNQLEIISSPLNDDDDDKQVKTILEKYVPDIRLGKSTLKIRARNNG